VQKQNLKDLLEVFFTLQVTKELPRQGFINFGFKRNESDSVAAHSFTVSSFSFFLALMLRRQGIDINPDEALKIALMHDMGEAISGDIGYHVKRFAGDDLHDMEIQTFDMLVGKLDVKDEIVSYYNAYREHTTLEAKVVKLADALDAYTQMHLTPGTDMRSVSKFMGEKVKDFSHDESVGGLLKEIFDDSIALIIAGEITFLGA
jgi:putative hydrolase of HD superfamily